jgi:hypothetical protein
MPKPIRPPALGRAVREVNRITCRVDPRAEPTEGPPVGAPLPPRSGMRSAQVPPHPTPVPAQYAEFVELREELQSELVDDREARVAELQEIVVRKERQIVELAEALRRANSENTELVETVERLRRFVDKLSNSRS